MWVIHVFEGAYCVGYWHGSEFIFIMKCELSDEGRNKCMQWCHYLNGGNL